jgi:hypothetical protein
MEKQDKNPRMAYIKILRTQHNFVKWFFCIFLSSLYNLLTFCRDEFASPERQGDYTVIHILHKLPSLPVSWLIVIILIILILWLFEASYSIYKKREEKINELSGNNRDIKQEIRNFLESIKFVGPEILNKIDAKEEEIVVQMNILNQIKLTELSEHPDFDKFLFFEKGSSYTLNSEQMAAYHLYPKDALRK